MRTLGLLSAACLLSVPLAVWGQSPGTNTVTATSSQVEVDTFNTTNVTQRVDTFSTEIRARIGSGPFLYDQTFNVAFSDPAVQNAITAARNVLTGAGAITITGPTQISSNTSQVNSQTNTVQTNKQTTSVVVGTKEFVGPATITVGNLGICTAFTFDSVSPTYANPTGCSLPGTPFAIVAGGIDFDTRTLTQATVSQTATTTNTFLTTQVFELDAGQPAPTPAPPSLILALTGLVGAGLYSIRRRFARLT
ncbi:MAG TPA: hypothetical protein VEU96_32035 [Bryobacteraceae bacterium]|nr:hypothetical protein [Bryobacteraceae bacterium]